MNNLDMVELWALREGAEKGALNEARSEKLAGLEARMRRESAPATGYSDAGGNATDGPTAEDRAFTRYLRSGEKSPELRMETRDPTGMTTYPGGDTTSNAANAGYLVPQGFWQNLQVALKAYGGLYPDFREVQTPTGNPMNWPTIDPTEVTASVLATENTQLSLDEPYVFGSGMLHAWTIYNAPFLVSLQTAMDSAFDIDSFVAARAGEAIGRELSNLAYSGTGSSQPLGLNTALTAKGAVTPGSGSGGYYALGAATAVKTFAGTTTELIANVLSPATCLDLVACVNSAYWPTSCWYMNATQALNQRGVVDDNGRPLLNLEDGYADGAIGHMMGFPVKVVPEIGDLSASVVQGPVFGSMQHAMVNRMVSGGIRVMRLEERFADYLSLGFISFLRCDFRSNDLRAAVTVEADST